MKALSLIQPYATLIALGYKLNETRSFKTNYRGPLLIHASLSKPKWAREVCEPPKGKYKPWEEKPQPNKLIVEVLERHGLTFDTLPRGVILARCELAEVLPITMPQNPHEPGVCNPDLLTPMELAAGNYDIRAGRFAWQLVDIEALLQPIPAKGSLGLWNPAN